MSAARTTDERIAAALESIDRLLSAGAVADENVPGVYWLNNHCFLVKSDGTVEEL